MPAKPCSAPDCKSPRYLGYKYCRRHFNAKRREIEPHLEPKVKVPWRETLPIDDGPEWTKKKRG